MSEGDEILFISFKQAGIEISEEVKTIEDFDASNVISVCSQSLKIIHTATGTINNKVKIHIYDKKNQIQIQADGLAKIIRNSKNSKMIWDSLSTYSKAIYLTKNPPGTIIKNAKTNLEKLDHNKGYGNFTIVNVEISKIYFLKLNSEINKKAMIKYENKNNKYHWLIP